MIIWFLYTKGNNMADYHTEWCKEHTTQFKLRLNNNTDADIIAFLSSLPNKQGFIKELIRKEMTKIAPVEQSKK